MKKFDFSKEFGNIDPKYISEAEGEWKGKKKAWTPSFWSKLCCLCDSGFDFNGFIESKSTGRD